MDNSLLVSIIIRTCGRISILKNALKSVCEQSYPNIEIVIVEDGSTKAQQFVEKSLAGFKHQYYSTGIKCGRTKAGNLGLSKAKGNYINFLDEDDILLRDHIKILLNALQTGAKAAYSVAEEHQIKVISQDPYRFVVKRKLIRYRHPFNRLLLCYMNYFPIQSVMFHRELYERYGGFDETLDILEDWDLWMRYAFREAFLFVNEITSVYYTAYRSREKRHRDIELKNAELKNRKKLEEYNITFNGKQIHKDLDYIINVFGKGNILIYLKKIQNYLLYHDR